MTNINELSIPDDKITVDYDNIPEEYGDARMPAPQPGPYMLQLPDDLSNTWEVIERAVGKRVAVALTGEHAMTMFLPDNATRPFNTWINNAEYPRGTEKIPASDMQYLIRALDPTAKPTTNKEFVTEMSKHAGVKFKASVEWSAYCNVNKDAYFHNAETGATEVAEGTKGCGAKFYQSSIPVNPETGLLEESFECTCGAMVRAWPNLRNFKPAA